MARRIGISPSTHGRRVGEQPPRDWPVRRAGERRSTFADADIISPMPPFEHATTSVASSGPSPSKSTGLRLFAGSSYTIQSPTITCDSACRCPSESRRLHIGESQMLPRSAGI